MHSVLSHLTLLWRPFFSVLNQTYRRWTAPARSSFLLETLSDLSRNRSEILVENALLRQQLLILRRQVKRPHLNPRDRLRLLLLASWLSNWRQALLIIQPDTLLRWHRAGFRLFWKHKSKSNPPQPKIPTETIGLIKQMALENLLWGAERIQGELLKLGLHAAKPTIQKSMRQARPPRAPSQSWSTFLRNHAMQTWACDFLPTVDLLFRQIFLFFVIEVGSRRVVHCGVTRTPTAGWVAQQLCEATPYGEGPQYLIRDRDQKYGTLFDVVARASGIEILKTPYRAPRANAICERFLGSLRRECLDHMLIWSERPLHRVVTEYVGYFNRSRPHQGLGQGIPEDAKPEKAEPRKGEIIAFPVLNGLHHGAIRSLETDWLKVWG